MGGTSSHKEFKFVITLAIHTCEPSLFSERKTCVNQSGYQMNLTHLQNQLTCELF